MSKPPKNQLPQSNGTSNVINIEQMAQAQLAAESKRVHKKFEEDNVGLSETIDKLLKELENKENQIDHLKRMLGNTIPIIGDLSMSNEEIIAEKQIARLREFSMLRELTLDEAKRLDIFVKIKNGPKEREPEKKSQLKDVTPFDLLKLASKKVEE
jgi:hypothetical protein